MSTRLQVPAIFHTSYRNLETKTVVVAKSENSHLLLGYYLLLAVCVVGTVLILDTTGIARTIMDASRKRTSEQTKIQNENNLAKIEITPQTDLRVLVYSPQNLYLGETADGLRYYQIPAGIIDHKHAVIINSATSGLYNLEFSAKNPGTYEVAIIFTDKTGKRTSKHTEKIVFHDTAHIRYNLTFNYTKLPDSNLVFKNIFYRP